jgi:hypothetical protein
MKSRLRKKMSRLNISQIDSNKNLMVKDFYDPSVFARHRKLCKRIHNHRASQRWWREYVMPYLMRKQAESEKSLTQEAM